jgi:hypothetical protein
MMGELVLNNRQGEDKNMISSAFTIQYSTTLTPHYSIGGAKVRAEKESLTSKLCRNSKT